MKAFSLVAFLLFISSLNVFSQLLVGPVAGANYSWTSLKDRDMKDAYRVGPVVGFHVGGHLVFKERKRFFLHTSSCTLQKVASLRVSSILNWLDGNGKLSNSDFEENNHEALSYKIVFKKAPEDQGPDEMNVEQPNRLQLGLNFVAGMVLEPAERQRIMISNRYELGHSYLAKTDGVFQDTYFQDPLQSRNRGFRISLAYLVDLKVEDRKKGKSNIDKRNPN